jgi:hypothetical protein
MEFGDSTFDRSPEKYITLALGAESEGMTDLAGRFRSFAKHLAKERSVESDAMFANSALQALLLADAKGEGYGQTILFLGITGEHESESSLVRIEKMFGLPNLRLLPLIEINGNWAHIHDTGQGLMFQLMVGSSESGQEHFMELSGHIVK